MDGDNRTMVQPDVMILCDKSKIRKWRIEGAPDFLAEVLSFSTRKRDLTVKLAKYMEAGVREYWLIDPDRHRLLVCRLEKDDFPEIYRLAGKVPVGICEELFVDLDAVDALIREYPD